MSQPVKLSPQVAEETSAQRPVNQTRAFEVLKKKASELDGRLSQAELQITPEAITLVVGDYAYSKGEIDLTLSDYSTITQTATQIATRVATTDYNGNTIASLINQTATTIAITADKINLNGAVTANNYFKILADGSMEATNGKFSGQLTATSGSITGSLSVTNYISAGSATPSSGKAGISGVGTTEGAVRFWAGETYANRGSAPFYVRDDGYLKASSGQIGGVSFSNNAYGLALDGGLSTGTASQTRLSSGFLTFLKSYSGSVTTLNELLTNPNLVITQGSSIYRIRVSGTSLIADDITSLFV